MANNGPIRLVRPWALAAPLLVLIVCLPLLRPLRHPDITGVSDDEAARLATVAALVQRHSLALDNVDLGSSVPVPNTGLIRSNGHTYSNQPPTLAVLLSGVYWILCHFKLTLRNSPVLTPYLLTLFGVTLPVAVATGLIYKMGRLFELRQPVRCGLAAAVVFGSGLLSYAVVLNPHAPAAALLLASTAGLIYVANSKKPKRNLGWLAASGACAGLAAAIDPPAIVFPFLLMVVILAMQWPILRRVAGIGLFCLGVAPPLYGQLAMNYPITGDWKPAMMHQELALSRTGLHAQLASWQMIGESLAPPAHAEQDPDADQPTASRWQVFLRPASRVGSCLLGMHGLLTHFPLIIMGMFGMLAVFHRNWPLSTKALAIASFVGGIAIIIAYALSPADGRGAMFANQWFVVFVPLNVFWAGAWLRRGHRPLSWVAAGSLLVFSVAVGVVGATDPLPRNGYDWYTAGAAACHLLSPSSGNISSPVATVLGT
jgi:4-amino-4-deoxy-L-arabinose transferase-like glycosyltransferase